MKHLLFSYILLEYYQMQDENSSKQGRSIKKDNMLTFTHATERDIDLLLVEELKCSRIFVEWLNKRIDKHSEMMLSFDSFDVAHSKRRIHTRREIDITLTLSAGSQRVVVLIENKLDTAPQTKQAESYREEAATLITDGAQTVWTVLICPASYSVNRSTFSGGFDSVISYEEIAAYFSHRALTTSGELSARMAHRAALLSQAITKARRGYEAVPLAPIGRFATRYVDLLRADGIDLPPGPSMLKADLAGESKTMIFAPTALPNWMFLPQTRLVHQLREGNANICLYTWGNCFNNLASIIGADLAETPYRLVPTVNKRVGGRSGLMIVADTPPVDNLASFDLQLEQIKEGQRATLLLRNWFASQCRNVEQWAERVSEIHAKMKGG